MVKPKLALDSLGDTIIEVLFAILVVGAILGGAYVAANRYYKNIIQAQEYSVATKIAEGQIEQIKSLVINPISVSDPLTYTATPFCVNDGILKDANTASNCTVSRYLINVTRTTPGSNEYAFNVQVSWDNINGGSRQIISTPYRIYR